MGMIHKQTKLLAFEKTLFEYDDIALLSTYGNAHLTILLAPLANPGLWLTSNLGTDHS